MSSKAGTRSGKRECVLLFLHTGALHFEDDAQAGQDSSPEHHFPMQLIRFCGEVRNWHDSEDVSCLRSFTGIGSPPEDHILIHLVECPQELPIQELFGTTCT